MEELSNTLTVAEAARKLGVHIDWIYHMLYAGKLTAKKVGRKWQLDRLDVERYKRESSHRKLKSVTGRR